MNNKIMKNIETSKVQALTDLVAYQDGQVVSKTLVQNPNVSLTLFSFDKGEEISTHSSHGDAMVYVIDGQAEITIGGEKFNVKAGETIVMPAEIPHAVYAQEQMKFMLTVVF
ncbi:MAG: cupin domain-containing protein [Eubacteriales bacterium]|nr:cupin domain-containing protein [Eubacteriales bacterium]